MCNWDGSIGCDGYNVGKCPDVGSIFEEWKLIAEAWPFLKLKCQLWDKGYDDCEKPVIEFIVENGSVLLQKPEYILEYNNENRDQGCSIDKFKIGINLSRHNYC